MTDFSRFNPFAWVWVQNTDADEAGDYRFIRRWRLWLHPQFVENKVGAPPTIGDRP